MARDGFTWLVLGSSPTAPMFYRIARHEADVVATSNGGINIEPRPDHYWITDAVAVRLFGDQALEAKLAGVNVIGSRFAARRTRRLGRLLTDIIDYPPARSTTWTPGKYANARVSGCMLVQYAVNHKALRVLLVGMEGYASGHGQQRVDYFDGRLASAQHEQVMAVYGPCLQSVFDQCPGVEFVFYGRPNYPWGGPNVTVLGATDPDLHAPQKHPELSPTL